MTPGGHGTPVNIGASALRWWLSASPLRHHRPLWGLRDALRQRRGLHDAGLLVRASDQAAAATHHRLLAGRRHRPRRVRHRRQAALRHAAGAAVWHAAGEAAGAGVGHAAVAAGKGHARVRVLQGQRQLQRLLRALVHHLLPKLALVSDAVQLALNVLLGDLQQAQHGVISLLADQVEETAVLLGRNLSPDFLHAARHILRAILPIQELHIHIQLLLRAVIHAGSREHANNLAKLDSASRELDNVVLKALEVLLVDLLIEFLVDRVQVLLRALVVFGTRPLDLAQVIGALADVHVVSGGLDHEAVGLVSQLVDVALGLAAGALEAADAEVQRIHPLGRLLGDAGVVPLHAVHAVVDLFVEILILLPQIGLQLRVADLEVSVVLVHLGIHLLVDLDMPVRRRLQAARLRGALLQAVMDGRMSFLHVALGLVVVGVDLAIHGLHLTTDLVQRLVHLPSSAVDLQAQGGGHVANGLDGGVDVVVHVVPGRDVGLRVQLRLGLVPDLSDVLGQLVAALVRLLEALGDVLHPSVVRLERFLHVAHVQAHRRDLRSHRRLDALP
mmetsp:Transcript_148447/g.475157  ORF Transcript_148447/g.475157 Transcript_148447/m.475157 type:complete len:558 (-) Transcript_148447:911-2584(-)